MARQVARTRLGPALMVALCLCAGEAAAASFDCRAARAADEVAICRDRVLNDQDVRLAALYQTASHFLGMGARDAFHDAQINWLAKRRRCGAARACLRRTYAARLREIDAVLERAYGLGPL